MLSSRGVYSLVTSFLFIVMIVFTVVSVIYIGAYLKQNKTLVNDQLVRYNNIEDAKNRIVSKNCYNVVPQEADLGNPCLFEEGIIRGYEIKMLEYGDSCTNKNWTYISNNDGEGQVFSYFISIQSASGQICPGRLKVIY